MPDVPQRAPAPVVERLAGLLGIVVVLEAGRAGPTPEVHHAVLADRELLAVVPTDVDLAPDGPAHRPGMGQRLLRGDPGHAHPLGARVVLVDDRAPPLDHPALHLGRARGCRVHHRAQRGHVVGGARTSSGSLSMRTNMVGTNCRVGHALLPDEPQACLGVEVLHDDRGPTQADRRHRPDQRGGVVQGRRAQVDVALPEAHDPPEHRGQDGVGTEGQPAQRPADPLGVAGGARRVQHGRALHLGGQRLAGEPRDEVVVALVALLRPVAHHEPQLHRRRQRHQLGGQGRQGRRRDQCAGATVHDDVRRLLGGEMRVDHGVVETGALETERHFMGPVVVGQQDGDVVPGPEPVGEQGLGQPAWSAPRCSAKVTTRPDEVMTAARSGCVAA